MTDTAPRPRSSDQVENEQFIGFLSVPVRLTALAFALGGPVSWWLGVLAAMQWRLFFQEQGAPAAFSDTVGTRNVALATTIICLVVAAGHMYVGARILLEARRARVSLTSVGIEIADWRGRVRTVRWDRIVAIQLLRCGGLCRPPKASISSDSGTWSIPAYLRDRHRLLAEVVRRSGLQRKECNWLGSRYARSS